MKKTPDADKMPQSRFDDQQVPSDLGYPPEFVELTRPENARRLIQRHVTRLSSIFPREDFGQVLARQADEYLPALPGFVPIVVPKVSTLMSYWEDISWINKSLRDPIWAHTTYGKNVALPRDRKSTRLNSSHVSESRMPSSA